MTNQEAFDAAYKHLLTQNEKAVALNRGCVYETPEGLRCAVGGVLPPDVRKAIMAKGMNGQGARAVMANVPEAAAALEGVSAELLSNLQSVHDSYPVEAWKARLAIVADWYHLTVPAL